MSQIKGYEAETKAKEYLIKKGLRFIVNNYRSRFGEIDLIMGEGKAIIFVEVRSRSHRNFGGAAETISFDKRQKLIKTAQIYLSINKLHGKFPVRFDVVTLEGMPLEVVWIKNAFGMEGI